MARGFARQLLAQRAELGGPGHPRGALVVLGPVDRLVVALSAPDRDGYRRCGPVVGGPPVAIRGHIQTKRLGGSLARHPEVVRCDVTNGRHMSSGVRGTVGPARLERWPVVAVGCTG